MRSLIADRTHGVPTPESAVVARLRAAGCVYAEDEARLLMTAAHSEDELGELVDRRVSGVPLEHVVGWAEFCGLRIAVEAPVFVPRRRSEFLVRQAAAGRPPGAIVVDLCCGSGALGAALAAAAYPIELSAVDLDPRAVACARRNLAALDAQVYEGDLYAVLPAAIRGFVDVIVAVPPYVPTDELRLLPGEARLHEDPLSLDGGVDGLDVARRIAAGAREWLAPGGSVFIEASDRQAAVLLDVLERTGLPGRIATLEELDATVVCATVPA
jgi:release factor glutamine methyltransferase